MAQSITETPTNRIFYSKEGFKSIGNEGLTMLTKNYAIVDDRKHERLQE